MVRYARKENSSTHVPNERLRQERLSHGWSQADVARQVGTDCFTVNRWERGRAHPSPHFRQRLCALFAKTVSELELWPELPQKVSPVPASPPSFQPRYCSLPCMRNPCFTGREEVLHTIHTFLTVTPATKQLQALALVGLGGIGKTQVAIEYAYRYADCYQAVFWLAAETTESLVASMQQIAEQLNLPEGQEAKQDCMLNAVQRWFATWTGWLLIADNVEDMDILRMVLPANCQGTLLVTSRQQTLGPLIEPFALLPMNMKEGMELLGHAVRRSLFNLDATATEYMALDQQEEAAARELVTALGGLPLALDQARAYIEEAGCSIADYLQRFRTQRKQVLAHRGRHSGVHPDSVSTTLTLSIEQVADKHPMARELLKACAFLYPEAIPEEFFVEGGAQLGDILSSMVADPYQFDQALAVLRSSSLVRRHAETHSFSLHRLVQAVLQDQMSQCEEQLWRERIIKLLSTMFPDGTFATWRQCERYLTHAMACLQLLPQAENVLAQGGELLCKIGGYLLERGRYREAEPLLEQALGLGERQYECMHPALIPFLMRRAELYWRQVDYQQAEALLQRILEIEEHCLEADHPEVAEALNNLALLYWQQEKYEQAEPLYQRALAIREQRLGPEHLGTASTLANLALLYWKQQRYEQAEPLYLRALQIEERCLGREHPETAGTLHNLAYLYRDLKRYEEAELLYQRALHIYESQLGPEHPEIAGTLNCLAHLYRDLDKCTQAEALYQRALHIEAQQLESDHVEVANTLRGLAALYEKQKKYEQAEALYQRALQIYELHLGPEQSEVTTTRGCLERLQQSRL
ncbi:tetratricopeptide repeat protein [Ktedonosporobacter rubrisoli]|uniref:Tetratricopeptide repeat protein n=1 Tax=Ktedonosporobacter rubrisoli TaxID=2509675 RepID=A0A4V0YYL1_KTERU|nr:tetratricopeptide repeat protein [Ktedonosporobacter rubrisoli]QBD76601.1 tetratricopeptide repeat protein [Ktedonosporobacter rubrisoli]